MARLKQKGKAGAAKAYVTRSAAIKKLQCSLADFRRLCILKGIFPREPRNRKRANKGSSAPTSFYYAKDIAYLAHEPVLRKLREHKAFAKKLSRALGRGEWSSAKSLEANKPVYRLDHIIRERYPTFIDALRDIDDALCMISLFSSLPSSTRLPVELVDSCWRLSAEWQLYVMHTRSLRKVFLSIKGVYYQAEVMNQTITWLVPYQFTQNVPADVDIRIMMTFLELYQTLLGFVLFKLYTDAGLTYPLPLDKQKEDRGAGVNALHIQNANRISNTTSASKDAIPSNGHKISDKEIRQTIKSINASLEPSDGAVELSNAESMNEEDEEFVSQSAETDKLPTLKSLMSLPHSSLTSLFAPYTFFLSRETSRPIFEFVVRSFGGRIGWPPSSGNGSPFNESDESITHLIIDRPLTQKTDETTAERARRLRRKFVQPQWVVDCINAGRILFEEPYEQGKTLPPHLSPFGENAGAYDPTAPLAGGEEDAMSDDSVNSEGEEAVHPAQSEDTTSEPGLVVAATVEDSGAVRAAELAAEVAGMDYSMYEKRLRKLQKKSKRPNGTEEESEKDMNKMMMSNKRRKLYEMMKYGERKRERERIALEIKKRSLMKTKKSREGV